MGMITFGDFSDKPMQAQNVKIEVSWSNDETFQVQNVNIEVSKLLRSSYKKFQ